jgi:hypothetical protein
MKITAAVICLFFSFFSFAQHTPEEIKKHKIGSCTETETTGNGISPSIYKTYYDRSGNDTAFYAGDLKIYHRVYNSDEKGKIISVLHYDKNGIEVEKSVYSYEPDSSYMVASKHKSFDVLVYKWFDKKGRLLKEQRDDESKLFYDYNAKGQLIQVMTMLGPGGKGDIEQLKYTYNKMGQRIKEVSLGAFRWTKTFTYDAKELLIKSVTVATDEGLTTTRTVTYAYEFWK